MMACTSPAFTFRLMPCKIFLPPIPACKFLISSIFGPLLHSLVSMIQRFLPYAALQTDTQKLLSFNRKFHRQFAKHFLAKAVDNHAHGILSGQTALFTVEDLIFADL